MEDLFCTCCHRTMDEKNFYRSLNPAGYPENNRFLPVCKKCLTRHIDPWRPETFARRDPFKPDEPCVLEMLDAPWVPDEWNTLLAKWSQSPNFTPLTILGKYISKMRLIQYKGYYYKDSDHLQEMRNLKIRDAMQHQGFTQAEIDEAIQKAYVPTPARPEEELGLVPAVPNPEKEVSKTDYGLTEKDRSYLRLKWGKNYNEDEWVQLEQLYNDMMNSYDIQTAGHRDTLKLICKSSLKANQLIDLGDIDGYQKAMKVYNDLMRAGNFTAAQNKSERGDMIDSVSELVAMCESKGFIPRYYIDEPKDKVDRVIQDLQSYTRSLIMEESNLGSLIESSVKQIQADTEKEQAIDASEDATLEDELFGETGVPAEEEIPDDE